MKIQLSRFDHFYKHITMLKFTGSINPESILGWEGMGVLVGYKNTNGPLTSLLHLGLGENMGLLACKDNVPLTGQLHLGPGIGREDRIIN